MMMSVTGFAFGYLAHNGNGVNALSLVIIGDSSLESLLGKNGAVELGIGQTVQSLYHSLVGELQSVLKLLSLYHLGRH